MIKKFIYTTLLALSLGCTLLPATASAEQGSARIDLRLSKTHVLPGEEFSVDYYVEGLSNTQFGSVEAALDAWYANDPNPIGAEFVRFEAADSDFPVFIDQSIKTGEYGYQCRSFTRHSNTDMTGRHLFGRFVYKAVTPGSYGFAPAMPCRNVIESLTGNWGIVWDYNLAYYDVDKPAASITTTSSPQNSTAPPSSTIPSQTSQTANSKSGKTTSNTSPTLGSTTSDNSLAAAENISVKPESITSPTNNHAIRSASIAVQPASKHSNYFWPIITITSIFLVSTILLITRIFQKRGQSTDE